MGCHLLLQGIFPTQGAKPRLLYLPALAGGFFTTRATWEAQNYRLNQMKLPAVFDLPTRVPLPAAGR